MKKYIAIDIGGTRIKHGLIDENGQILQKHELASQAHLGGSHLVTLVHEIIADYLARETIEAVGISTAGMVDPEKGEIIYSGSQIPNYIGINWKESIRDRFGLRCEVENDVNCAGLSEYIIGSGKDFSSCVCLTIGTGIGACMVVEGEIFHGAHGAAFEVGYMNMGEGTYQEVASTTALVQAVAKRLKLPPQSLNGHFIFERAKAGDPVCNEEIDRLMDHIAFGIANICYVSNPAIVILGGGIMEQSEFLKPKLQKALEKNMLDYLRSKTEFAFAKNGNTAGMLGAYYHLRRREQKR